MIYNCLCGVHSVLMCLCVWYIGKNARLLSVGVQPNAGYYSVRFARSCFLTWESLCPPRELFSASCYHDLPPHPPRCAFQCAQIPNLSSPFFGYTSCVWIRRFSALPFPAKALYILCKCSAADFVGRLWNLWAPGLVGRLLYTECRLSM